jgi:hypothetical protein
MKDVDQVTFENLCAEVDQYFDILSDAAKRRIKLMIERAMMSAYKAGIK